MLKSMLASSKHFRIYREESEAGAAGAADDESKVYIEDSSQNGTLVNGTRVPKGTRRALQQGDQQQTGRQTCCSRNHGAHPTPDQEHVRVKRITGRWHEHQN